MNVFFMPAVRLMDKLKYRKKLILLGSISALLVLVLTYQHVIQSLATRDFSHKELQGIKYIDPLIIVMKNIQQYRKLENDYLLGNPAIKTTLDAARDEIDHAIVIVDTQDAKLGQLLKTSEYWDAIKNKWLSLKNDSTKMPEKSNFAEASNLIANIQSLIITACDNSNLTLDPDIDTYYSMDTYCTKMPNFSEEVALIRDFGTKAISMKTLTPENRTELIIKKTLMYPFNIGAIKGNLAKVLKERPALSTTLDPLLQPLISNTTSLSNLLDTTLLANNFNISLTEFSDKTTLLMDLGYKFSSAVSNSLYNMVQERINKILKTLYANIFISIIGLLFLVYLLIGVYLSVISSIRILVTGSEKLAAGNFDSDVQLQTRDELTQVASSFNIMRDSLSRIIKELHFVVKSEMQGNLGQRIKAEAQKGFFHDFSVAINRVSDVFRSLIKDLTHVLDRISKGDLTASITKNYQGEFGELKKYLDLSQKNLEKLIGQVKVNTAIIHNAAKEIAVGNNDLAKRTEQQATFLEETATSIKQVTIAVRQNAENAKQANQLAQSASEVAVKGGSIVGQVIAMMTTIHESSHKVVDIISVIDDIAFQTNILALNAAVEAARAGEQGRGFAVVATEVRNLAQRSSNAAKEIKILISNSVKNVASGTKLVDQAGKTMQEIVSAVTHVTEIMAEIASASMEQSNGIEQVNQAITQMDQVTQQNTTLVEKAANAAKSMETQTIQMDNLVRIFKVSQEPLNISDDENENKGEEKKDELIEPIDFDRKEDKWE